MKELCGIFAANITEAGKHQLERFGLTGAVLTERKAQAGKLIRQLHVQHTAAFSADKVCMRIHPGIEMLLPLHMAHRKRFPLFAEHAKIAVNRAEAEIRILPSEGGIQGLRRGMLFGSRECIKNSCTLYAVLTFDLHILSQSFDQNNNNSYY